MYCPNCGKIFEDGLLFCDICGIRLKKETEENEQSAAPIPVTPPEVPQETQPGNMRQNEIPKETTYETSKSLSAASSELFTDTTPNTRHDLQPEVISSRPAILAAKPVADYHQASYQQKKTPPSIIDTEHQAPVIDDNSKVSNTVSFPAWMGIHLLNFVPFSFGFLLLITIFARNIYLFAEGKMDFLSLVLLVPAVIYVALILVWAIGRPKARSLKNYALAAILTSFITVIILTILYLFVDPELIRKIINAYLYFFDIPYEFY